VGSFSGGSIVVFTGVGFSAFLKYHCLFGEELVHAQVLLEDGSLSCGPTPFGRFSNGSLLSPLPISILIDNFFMFPTGLHFTYTEIPKVLQQFPLYGPESGGWLLHLKFLHFLSDTRLQIVCKSISTIWSVMMNLSEENFLKMKWRCVGFIEHNFV
jgi:hypothetical protein